MTPDLAALRALRDRLGEATEGSRELDAAIWRAFVKGHGAVVPDDAEGYVIGWYEQHPYGSTTAAEWLTEPLPRYTSSLDDAEALMRAVLPGAWWRLTCSTNSDGAPAANVDLNCKAGWVSIATRWPAPLAWCHAIVEAKIAEAGG